MCIFTEIKDKIVSNYVIKNFRIYQLMIFHHNLKLSLLYNETKFAENKSCMPISHSVKCRANGTYVAKLDILSF
jgi:hypothetical protein